MADIGMNECAELELIATRSSTCYVDTRVRIYIFSIKPAVYGLKLMKNYWLRFVATRGQFLHVVPVPALSFAMRGVKLTIMNRWPYCPLFPRRGQSINVQTILYLFVALVIV